MVSHRKNIFQHKCSYLNFLSQIDISNTKLIEKSYSNLHSSDYKCQATVSFEQMHVEFVKEIIKQVIFLNKYVQNCKFSPIDYIQLGF